MLRKNNSLILLLLLLTGCKTLSEINIPLLPGFRPFKINIQQGNVITQDMVDKLRPGMTRSQVRFVLGTPLVIDAFRNDRWDYVYTMSREGTRVEQRQFKVFFKDDKLDRFDGDVVLDGDIAKPIAMPDKVEAVKPAASNPVAVPATAVKSEPMPAVKSQPASPVVPVQVEPQLRLAPNEGQAAKPEEKADALAPPQVAPATPAPAESLEAPPLPRLVLPPEPAEPATPQTFAPASESTKPK